MIYIALAVLVVLQALDLWTTSRFPRGSAQEANPLMRKLWERFGFGSLVAMKVVVTGAVIAYVLLMPATPFVAIIVAAAIFIQAWVVGGNLM